jgi:hypothetical protein
VSVLFSYYNCLGWGGREVIEGMEAGVMMPVIRQVLQSCTVRDEADIRWWA